MAKPYGLVLLGRAWPLLFPPTHWWTDATFLRRADAGSTHGLKPVSEPLPRRHGQPRQGP